MLYTVLCDFILPTVYFYSRFLFDTNCYTKDNTVFNYAINHRVPMYIGILCGFDACCYYNAVRLMLFGKCM